MVGVMGMICPQSHAHSAASSGVALNGRINAPPPDRNGSDRLRYQRHSPEGPHGATAPLGSVPPCPPGAVMCLPLACHASP